MDQRTADTVKRMVEAWNAHDLDTVYGLCREDYRQYNNGTLAVQGPDAARAADEPLYEAIPDYRREVDELIVSGSAAAMRWRFLGTGRNGPFEVPAASFAKVEDGKIVEAWLYIDTALFRSASGLGPDSP